MTFRLLRSLAAGLSAALLSVSVVQASPFEKPWEKDLDQAIVLDAYEFNPIEWETVLKDDRIAGFINKSSDGMPPAWSCKGDHGADSTAHCRTRWRKYVVAKELYRTRRALAKANGWKWGAYHLGRPGNPVKQADHFIEFADPQPDELIAIDVEHDDPDKWMSLEDAEIFAKRIYSRLGRYPVLYTNHFTAKAVAARKDDLPLLSRLPLWYARYTGDIEGVFPMGNWESYAVWQFVSMHNCSKNKCPYRVEGTPMDIDVNITMASRDELDRIWPLDELVPLRRDESEMDEPASSSPFVAILNEGKLQDVNRKTSRIVRAYAPEMQRMPGTAMTASTVGATPELTKKNYQSY